MSRGGGQRWYPRRNLCLPSEKAEEVLGKWALSVVGATCASFAVRVTVLVTVLVLRGASPWGRGSRLALGRGPARAAAAGHTLHAWAGLLKSLARIDSQWEVFCTLYGKLLVVLIYFFFFNGLFGLSSFRPEILITDYLKL